MESGEKNLRTRPLARRAGVEGFVTAFVELPPRSEEHPPPDAEALGRGRPLDLGLDFSIRPRLREAPDGRVTLGCVLVSEAEQEVGLALGTFRGACWRCGHQRGATSPVGLPLEIRQGRWPLKLRRGLNLLTLAFQQATTSGWACVCLLDAKCAVRVGLPDGLHEDPDAGAPPEFTRLNRPGTLQAREGLEHGAWHGALRERWEALLELDRPGESGGTLKILESADAGRHTRLRILVGSPLGADLPAHLLIPKAAKGPLPGVLAVHGHGPGRGRVIGTQPDDGHRNYGVLLAERGYVVLAPEIRNFGERQDPLRAAERYKRDPCDVQFIRGIVSGAWPARTEALEWRAWLDALAEHPQVDAGRLGVLGLSLGGRTSGLIAALDRRVKAAVVSGALNTMRERVLYGQGCVKYLLPGLLRLADLPGLYALAAPRALFLELGAGDGTSPEIFAQEAYRRIQLIYEAAGAGGRLGLHVFDGGHYFNGERSLPWLDEQLKG